MLNETATVGDPTPELRQDRAITVLSKLQLPAATRLRLFTPTGQLVADSNTLSDRIVQRPLPSSSKATKKSQDEDILAARITPWRPERTLEQERAIALRGDRASGQRVTDSGDRVISVSLPIQHVQAVLGVLTLESADVDEILAAERRSMLPFIVAAGAISLLFSALLSLVIAKPLRALAYAADEVVRSNATRLVLPEENRRKDEIGRSGAGAGTHDRLVRRPDRRQ